MWIVNSELFFPNAQPNYWQVFEGANQGGLLIISEHPSLWWGIKKAFICPSGPAPNCKHQEHPKKGAPARTPHSKQPNITLQSFEIPQSHYKKCCFQTGLGDVQKAGQCGRDFRLIHLCFVLGNKKATGVFYIQAPSQVKNIDLFSEFWLRQFNQFTSLCSDVNFQGQIWVELGAAEWGQFLMRWNSKEMRLKTNHSYITVFQSFPVPSRLTVGWNVHRIFQQQLRTDLLYRQYSGEKHWMEVEKEPPCFIK